MLFDFFLGETKALAKFNMKSHFLMNMGHNFRRLVLHDQIEISNAMT